MIISIVASGTRGDVQPYVALGKGLKAAGYTVQVLTTDDFEELVRDAGLAFFTIGSSIESVLQSDEWLQTMEGGNFLKILSRMMAEMKTRSQAMAAKLPALFGGTDLIVTGMGGMTGTLSIAEKLNIPLIQAYVFPITPTRDFPGPLTPKLPMGRMLNRLSYLPMRQMLWQSGRMADVIVRRELSMPHGSFFGPYRSLKQKRVPLMYGYSKYVLASSERLGRSESGDRLLVP